MTNDEAQKIFAQYVPKITLAMLDAYTNELEKLPAEIQNNPVLMQEITINTYASVICSVIKFGTNSKLKEDQAKALAIILREIEKFVVTNLGLTIKKVH